MKTQTLKKVFAFTIILVVFSNCKVSLIDLSPDRPNGASNGGVSTAGLVLNIVGDKNALYAVGLNSGVWKTQLNVNGNFDVWKQLSQSPRYAHCIAVDPNSPDHIAVGERDGDAIFAAQNNCGLWESYDGGKTFDSKYYYNPLLSGPCRQDNRTQVVNGVVITNSSTTIITTPCGLARKPPLTNEFKYADLNIAVDEGGFTALAVFKDWIVARTKNLIVISNDDGKTWDIHPIRFNFNNQNFSQGDRGELYSVCILQDPETKKIFVYVPATRNPNGPCIGTDKGVDACLGTETTTCNYCSFLVFDNKTGDWNYQIIKERGLGVGLGGRIFMKSFFSSYDYLQKKIGGNTNLFYCGAQSIFKAKKLYSNGTADWENIANANVCGESKPSGIHADLWDFHLDPSGSYSYVGCDGGVYSFTLKPKQSTIDLSTDNQYVNLNSGLHISHIHEAFVAGYLGNRPSDERYSYGAQDNGGWQSPYSSVTDWTNVYGGDANFCRGDQGNPNFFVTGTHLESAVLQTFDTPTPAGVTVGAITISHDQSCSCRTYSSSFQFIQTMANEGPRFYLDAVMLATLPLTYTTDNKTFNPIPQFAGTTGLAIIRNSSFAQTPDINKITTDGKSGWSIEFNDLPAGVQGMYVSGGHTNPTYFLICNQSAKTLLYVRKKTESKWTQITLPKDVSINNYSILADQHAPFFINPYNPSELYVSCNDGIYHGSFTSGVRSSIGQIPSQYYFEKDVQLTNFVTSNGKYPVDRDFIGGNDNSVVHSNQSNLNAMFPISSVSFNRYHPEQVVASSPYTGVFYKNGNQNWKDFSSVLPKPFTPVSSVNINNQGIYVTTEGRGIFKIVNY